MEEEKKNNRLEVLKKILQFEKEKNWNSDVENDLPSIELKPNKVDYLNKKLKSKFLTYFVNKFGDRFIDKLIKNKQLIIEKIEGIDNFNCLSGGAILTSNHFHPFDNFAIWKAIKPSMKKKMLYKVIKEGNFTNPDPKYKMFFRHCNTLPLSSNQHTMKNFLYAVEKLLKRGEKILIYPEQSMWWNYKKPRPLKIGAFKLACKNNVPVIPIFISMRDSELLDENGFPIQKLTLNFLEPIYPDKNLGANENAKIMMEKNYNAWVEAYEKFYNKKLIYD